MLVWQEIHRQDAHLRKPMRSGGSIAVMLSFGQSGFCEVPLCPLTAFLRDLPWHCENSLLFPSLSPAVFSPHSGFLPKTVMGLVLGDVCLSIIKFTFIISHFNYTVSFLTPSLPSFPSINVDSWIILLSGLISFFQHSLIWYSNCPEFSSGLLLKDLE